MTEIQQNRWDRLIRRAANVVGGGSQVNDTLNELFPVMDIENVPAELFALMATQLGWCSSSLGASPAEFNHHQLFNPAGSGSVISITQVSIVNTTNLGTIRFTNSIAALTTLTGNERRRDTRSGVLASIVAQNRTAQDGVSGGLDFRIRVLKDETTFLRDDNGICVIFPGTGLTVTTESTNVGSICSFLWRERVFEPAEVNF